MSVFFEVTVKATARLLVEMDEGQTAEEALAVAVSESRMIGDITAENARLIAAENLGESRRHCDDVISL